MGKCFAGTLFIMLMASANHDGIYMWLGHLSFTYTLVGIYLAVHSLFSSLDSTTTVFSVLYYGMGAFLFLAAGIGVFSKGYDGMMGIVIGSFSVALGGIMTVFAVCGSKM
ncbi:uncharacterized protein LOC125758598 [Rhipicephalus sanguineus]|uniref:uncharacterized protein LOC125758598 n=1 Tax=Rhipicephalus sanguineus TaxID=34632 RepID=UPI0020C3EBEC|nr:uncharacterized protein LOC125758598 [Rhipicephalus sanguineus]